MTAPGKPCPRITRISRTGQSIGNDKDLRASRVTRCLPFRERTGGRGLCSSRGAILLEVIFSLTLFAAMAAVVIGGLNSCIQTANDLRIKAQAVDMAVTLLSEIQMGLVPPTNDGPTDYPPPDDEWCWQITTATMDPVPQAPAQTQVTITVTNKAEAYSYSLVYVVMGAAGGSGEGVGAAGGGVGGGP